MINLLVEEDMKGHIFFLATLILASFCGSTFCTDFFCYFLKVIGIKALMASYSNPGNHKMQSFLYKPY